MAGTVVLTRGSTLPDSAAKADFHNLIDDATGTISGIISSEITSVSGASFVSLANIPVGAGVIPAANISGGGGTFPKTVLLMGA